MVELPAAFMEETRRLMGEARFGQYLAAFEVEPPVSIRLNPWKTRGNGGALPVLAVADAGAGRVPWCRDGWYLSERPNFTMDPLLHAGCYYVQEAASMFLDEVLRQHLPLITHRTSPMMALDLCAAPGGKSTLLRAVLPADSMLYSNEPVRQRASVLAENVQKWGYSNHVVTNNYPADYRRSGLTFDLILCDVPCSGEGMFRKDAATIGEWSPQQVERCAALQRSIVSDAWACLRPGGLLIYSTCTFNTRENEENIQWLLDEYADAEVLPVGVRPEWGITGSLLEGFAEPVFRFIPGFTRGEGLFMCVLQKRDGQAEERNERKTKRRTDGLNYLLAPDSAPLASDEYVELTYRQAMDYLRREAITLPAEAPRGVVNVGFMGRALGPVKNIGTRANNLYPKEWRIKTTRIPQDYEPVLTPAT